MEATVERDVVQRWAEISDTDRESWLDQQLDQLNEREKRREKESGALLTLDQLTTGMTELAGVWPGYYYRSPKIKQLRWLFRELSKLQVLTDGWDKVTVATNIVSSLVYKMEEDGSYRQASADEIEDRFDMGELNELISYLLEQDGFVSAKESPSAGETPVS